MTRPGHTNMVPPVPFTRNVGRGEALDRLESLDSLFRRAGPDTLTHNHRRNETSQV